MAEATMVGAKPSWFVDKLWRGRRFKADTHGYCLEIGDGDKVGDLTIFVEDANGFAPDVGSDGIKVSVLSVRDWDHDRNGVAVVEPHEFSNEIVVSRRGQMTAWDQAVQVVEMVMAVYDARSDLAYAERD